MKGFCLILWMFMTLILAFSLVGLLIFIPKEGYNGDPSTWMQMGLKLLDAVITDK